MTDDFKDEIRSRMRGEGEVQQTVSSGLFGIADPDLFVQTVRNTYPGATVGGVTSDGIEGAVLRVGTGQTRVFKDEIESMLDELGENRVSQSSWSVGAKRWVDGDDSSASVTGQEVTVRVDGVQRVLTETPSIETVIVEEAVERGWPPGANTPAFDRGVLGDVQVSPIAGEVVYRLDTNSVDASSLQALESYPRQALQRVGSVADPLGLPTDQRIEIERALADEYNVREVEVKIIP